MRSVSVLALTLLSACPQKSSGEAASMEADASTRATTARRQPSAPASKPRLQRAGKDLSPPKAPDPKVAASHLARGSKKGCGAIEIEGVEYPLECLPEDEQQVRAAKPIALPFAPNASLPEEVDHRLDHTEGVVRAQNPSESCTAFSFVAGVDHALLRHGFTGGPVSVMQAWARYHATSVARAAETNLDKGLAAESDWPFDGKTACTWMACNKETGETRCPVKGLACAQPVDDAALARADARPIATVTSVTQIEEPEFKASIARGQDVWFCMKVDGHMKIKADDPVIPDFDATQRTSPNGITGHCMLLAGYRAQGDGLYFLIHNSMGEKWGDGGYGWIHERTLTRNMGAKPRGYLVDAKPKFTTTVVPTTACPPGEVHDSVTGACGAPCAENGPPHDGACPVEAHCPAGFTNLSGSCVVAAPAQSFSDKPSGVDAKCGPAGCAYTIASGSSGCAAPAGCFRSCPAPRYKLAAGPSGIFCTE